MMHALGIDAGGSRTRWALVDASANVVAEGAAGGCSALQMHSIEGQQNLRAVWTQIAAQLPAQLPALSIDSLHAGMSGFGTDDGALRDMLAQAFSVSSSAVHLSNDLEIAYRAAFAPGEGYLVYAGSGAIAAFIDAEGAFHRAGGRGHLLDDAGSALWIACQALRAIWRMEDVAPGSARHSPMGQAVLARVGGSDWAASRQFMQIAGRGELGMLALAVAESAESDPLAQQIFQQAGTELARLAKALMTRFGERPVILTGRAATLHALIEVHFRASLGDQLRLAIRENQAHHAAARWALQKATTRST